MLHSDGIPIRISPAIIRFEQARLWSRALAFPLRVSEIYFPTPLYISKYIYIYIYVLPSGLYTDRYILSTKHDGGGGGGVSLASRA